MSQEIKEIDIEDLVLWTENPRDPIDKDASDQDVVNNALDDKLSKWTLSKLAKEMRGYYDFSELPTVVYHGSKPVVYDGNRRMILAKIQYECVEVDGSEKIDIPHFPKKIPCNVCSKDIAVQNVFRKHGDSGSWSPLDRDIFLHKFLGEPKSVFLKLEEQSNLITKNPHLNKGFVKKEIFSSERLKDLGFEFDDDELLSKHNKNESESILQDITSKVELKQITTRKNRGKVIEVLDKKNRNVIEKNKSKTPKKVPLSIDTSSKEKTKRQTRRSKKVIADFFGGTLYLNKGKVNDLYKDIVDLYLFYQNNKLTLSVYFPSLIRMSLRLLSEAACQDERIKLDNYIKKHFSNAKKMLDEDSKTTMSSQNVNQSTIVQLLHIGAHNYQAANNMEQTIAVSIILGKILELSHGK